MPKPDIFSGRLGMTRRTKTILPALRITHYKIPTLAWKRNETNQGDLYYTISFYSSRQRKRKNGCIFHTRGYLGCSDSDTSCDSHMGMPYGEHAVAEAKEVGKASQSSRSSWRPLQALTWQLQANLYAQVATRSTIKIHWSLQRWCCTTNLLPCPSNCTQIW